MDIEKVFTYILAHPQNYPGKHQNSQPRTCPSHKPLEPKAQFHIIFKAMATYIKESMLQGKGVNLKGFGAFTYEVISDIVKPIQFSNFNTTQNLDQQRKERQHIHRIRPCFVPDGKLKQQLTYYNNKEEISAPKSQHSIFQKGFQMIFCNSGPIAMSCYLGKDVVQSALDAFIQATIDLIILRFNVRFQLLQSFFGAQKHEIRLQKRFYQWQQTIIEVVNNVTFESKMKKSEQSTSSHWKQSYQQNWESSTLGNILAKPDIQKVNENNEKTLALKIMSLDLNTNQDQK